MTKQTYSTLDVAKLEVQGPWPDMPNLLANPVAVGSAFTLSSWYAQGVGGTTSLSYDSLTNGIKLNVGTAPVRFAYHSEVMADMDAGGKFRVRVTRTVGAGTFRILVQFRNAAGAPIGSAADSGDFTGTGVKNFSGDVPVGTRSAQVYFRTTGSNALSFANVVLVMGALGAVTAASMTVAQAWITGILGPTHEVTIERKELDVGVLNALIIDSSLDPSSANAIRPNRGIRFMALVATKWEPVFIGVVRDASVTYELRDPRVPDEKVARIALSATDGMTHLANTLRPEGVAKIADLPYVLAGAGMPWNVNGSSADVDPATVTPVSYIETATAIDQIALTRDSVLGFAWLDRSGVVQVWDRADLGTTVVDVLDETTYSDVDIDFASNRVINTVTIKMLGLDAGTGSTGETTYGPFVNADSVREWGAYAAEFSVHGLPNDEGTAKIYADLVFVTSAVPKRRLNSVTLPLRSVAEFEDHALRDLYDLVTVSNDRAGIDEDQRVTSVKHRITANKDGARWFVDLGFVADKVVASPQATPSPSPNDAAMRGIGDVKQVYGTVAQAQANNPGWLVMNGAAYDTTKYPKLFAHLTAMVAAGVHTNATLLPNMDDRFPIAAGTKAVGSSGGTASKTIAATHLPTSINLSATGTASGGTTENGGLSVTQGGTGGRFAHPVQISGAAGTALDVMPPWRALYFLIRAA